MSGRRICTILRSSEVLFCLPSGDGENLVVPEIVSWCWMGEIFLEMLRREEGSGKMLAKVENGC